MRSDPSAPDLVLLPVTTSDLDEVARLHARAFPESAITAFGHEAVRRYYAWLLTGPHDAALIGAWRAGRLAGFCAAGVFRGAMNGYLRQNRNYLVRHMISNPRLLGSSLVRDRLKQVVKITLRFSRLSRKLPSTSAEPGPRFGVLAIATDPEAHGTGVGRALMREAEGRARSAGHAQMLLTVHPDNHRAVRFYEGLGWQRRHAGAGPWSGGMEKTLRDNSR